METDLRISLVRILSADGKTAGTGFVVSDDGLIATCSHVIQSESSQKRGDRRPASVQLFFQATGEPGQANIEPDWWRPAQGQDVAILRLVGPLPSRVQSLPLASSEWSRDHAFRSRGYRLAEHFPEGLEAEGKIQGQITGKEGQTLLQLWSNQIDQGMSGAPLWDVEKQAVVGMINAFWETRRHTDAWLALATTSETLHQVCPLLILKPAFDLRYEQLWRRYYHSPRSIFDRVQLDRFKGREWLLARIDAFLQDQDRGYFILEAEAGVGKTTFLAYLVQDRDYLHHFVELTPGTERISAGLYNLATQLIRAWELDPDLIELAARPDGFYELLAEAARRRNQIQPEKKIILVVDAVDEAGIRPGENVLGLPILLPQGVYIIVSQRPVPVSLKRGGQGLVFSLQAKHPDNLTDMRAYLEAAVEGSRIAKELQAKDYTPTEFIETLLLKCQGLWVYLYHILNEIELDRRSLLDLDSLPNGLWEYYAQQWGRWRNQDRATWYNQALPLLSTLAVVQEPVSAHELSAWAGVYLSSHLLSYWLEEQWRPFLVISSTDQPILYQFNHATLREFFTGRVKLEELTQIDQSFVKELKNEAIHAHYRLAEYWLTTWGSLAVGLPQLRQEIQQGGICSYYGVRHLTGHLEAADRWDLVSNLLNLTVRVNEQNLNLWAEIQKRNSGSYSSYLADIARVWDHSVHNKDVSNMVRCALIYGSIVSLLQYAGEDVILETVAPEAKLNEAMLILDPQQRLEILHRLLPSLNPIDQAKVKAMALEIARDIFLNDYLRQYTIKSFASFFTTAELEEMYHVAQSLSSQTYRGSTLCALVAYLPPSSVREEALRKLFEEFKHATEAGITSTGTSEGIYIWPMHPAIQYNLYNLVTEALPWIRLLSKDEQSIIFETILSNFEAISSYLDYRMEPSKHIGRFPPIVDLVAKWTPSLPEDVAKKIQIAALEILSNHSDDDRRLANGLLTLAPSLYLDLVPIFRQIASKIKSKWIQAEVLLYFESQLSDHEAIYLRRILNTPSLFVIEIIRQFRGSSLRFLLGIAIPLSVLIALQIWLVAQFKGGLKWDSSTKLKLTSRFTSEESNTQKSPGIKDDFERSLTLFSLGVFDSLDKQATTSQAQLWKDLKMMHKNGLFFQIKKLFFTSIWLSKQRYFSLYLDNHTYRREKPSTLLGIAGVLYDISTSTAVSWDIGDLELAKRLQALNISNFEVVGYRDTEHNFRSINIDETFIKLAAILPSLPSTELKSVLPELLDILQDLKSSNEDQAEMLILLSNLGRPHSESVLSQMISVTASIGRSNKRALTLSALIPHLLALPIDEAWGILNSYLYHIAKRGRQDLIIDLRVLIPLIEKLGGVDTRREVTKAIVDVGDWWP